MVEAENTNEDITPQSFYLLIVGAFPGKHTPSVWTSLFNHEICNKNILSPIVRSYSARQTIALNTFQERLEHGIGFVIVCAF